MSENVKLVLMKRETGAIPVRTRHRNSRATAAYHWETGKMADVLTDKPGDLPVYVQKLCFDATSNWQYTIKICYIRIFILSFALWQGTFYFIGAIWKIHIVILKTGLVGIIHAIKI